MGSEEPAGDSETVRKGRKVVDLEHCIKTQGLRMEAGGEAADQFTL